MEEEPIHAHPILKALFSKIKDKGISPNLETAEKRSRALVFSRRLSNSSSNGTSIQSKAPKVLKLNQEQQKLLDLEVKAMLEKGSISKVCH